MEIVGTNEYEDKRKSKKLMIMITAAIVVLLIISIILFLVIYYLKSKQFKFVVDGKNVSSYSNDLFIFEDEDIYVSLKDIASIIGYKHYNGGYKQYTEDSNKCYLECSNEIVTFERDSKKIYKTPVDDLDYTYYSLDESITRKNGKLYINSNDLGLACNLQIGFNKESNKVTINTLPYIANWYTTNYSNASVESNFNNQKALLYGLMVVQSVDNKEKDIELKDVKYGIHNLQNEEIVGMKYTNIEFIEGTEEFLVTTTEKKVGLITSDGTTRVTPQYDALKQIDKDKNLYLATNNNKSGIIEKNGKILIYLEFDQIGVDTTQFTTNDIKNKYILYNNAIPVMRDKKWGLYNVDGKQILPLEYDSMGCITRTSSDSSVNNILVIPEIEGIVVGKNFEVEKSKFVMYYGVVSSTGKELIPTWMETIYSVITSGQEKYTMVNMGNSMDIIDYIRDNNILDKNVENNLNENTNTINNQIDNNEIDNNVVNNTNEVSNNITNSTVNNISNENTNQQTVETVAQPTQDGTLQFMPIQ